MGLMDRQFRSRYLIRFNARKICDIIDLNQGISPREKKQKPEIPSFSRDIYMISHRLMIKTLIFFFKMY